MSGLLSGRELNLAEFSREQQLCILDKSSLYIPVIEDSLRVIGNKNVGIPNEQS